VALTFAAVAGSCGRIDFDPRRDAAPSPLSHVAPFVAIQHAATMVATFTAQAQHAGDTVLLATTCQTGTPSAVSVTAPGWTVSQVGPITGAGGNRWVASFAATVPDTAGATFTVTWTSPTTCFLANELGDEFASSTGVVAVDAHAETFTGKTPQAMLTTVSAGDLLWGACSSGGTLLATGAGYTKGADDGNDDWTEYEPTSDAAGTVEVVDFQSSGAVYALVAIALTANGP
jgi:hypothetical protein